EPPADGRSADTLAGDLIDHFPNYLRSKFATVGFDRTFDGKPTLHFHGSAAPGIHDDWVVREWFDRKIGFTAQTLKREFFVAGDDVGAAGGTTVGILLTPVVGPFLGLAGALGIGGTTAVHYNRMHFLA